MKPSYLKVIGSDPTYYVYTGVGKHAAVFKREFDSISPPLDSYVQQELDVAETMFTGLKKLNLHSKPQQGKPTLTAEGIKVVPQEKQSMLTKDADQILRQIDEDCAKE